MIPEFTTSVTLRLPEELRNKLEILSKNTGKTLSYLMRFLISKGFKKGKNN
jgi:predicted DNA-binding protein